MLSSLRILKNFALSTVKIGASIFLVHEYLIGFVVCNGPSMEPTIISSDIILTDHVSPRLGKINLGDVVIARNPVNYECICKRIVAMPGDVVDYKGDTLKIPNGYYWLEGDNKTNSSDSRDYGPVPQFLIRRRCFLKVWPTFNPRFGKEMHCEAALTEK